MLIYSIIGALIGAGFASGQEMYLFFYRFGRLGISGLAICSMLMGLIIYKTFSIITRKKINNYHEFLNTIFYSKGKSPKNKYLNLSYISNIIVNIFLLMTFYIMISGFGAYFEQQFNLNSIIGASVLAILCYFILIKDIKGVTKANSIIVPTLIIIIILIGIKNVGNINVTNISNELNYGWIYYAIIYCSYNMILVIPILVNLSKFIKNRKHIIVTAIISGLIMFVLGLIIYLLLSTINTDISKIEMPAVYAISSSFPEFKWIYGIVILLSIFSTAISVGISFLKNVVTDKRNYPQFVGIMCISGVLISNIGFSNLVKILFPVFGYLGLLQIFTIIIKKT